MADYGMFFGWNRVNAGMEKLAMEMFTSWMSYWGEHKEKGTIESFEPVILTAHGGDLNGFIMVKGNREKLQDLRWNDEAFMKLFMQTNMCLQGFGCVDAYVNEGSMELMKKWGEMIG